MAVTLGEVCSRGRELCWRQLGLKPRKPDLLHILWSVRILFEQTLYTAISVNYPIIRFRLVFQFIVLLVIYSCTMNQDSIPSRRKISCPQCTDLILGFTQSPIPGLCMGQEVNHLCPSSIKVMNTWSYTFTPHTSSWHGACLSSHNCAF